MSVGTLISAPALRDLLGRDDVLVVDCRSNLRDPAQATHAYAAGHVPGAVHAELETELSDLTKPALGRHPLPDASTFSAALARWGWTPRKTVVAYDAENGALAAARLWWLLRIAGHADVAVLDGGIDAWRRAGFAQSTDVPAAGMGDVNVEFDNEQVVDTSTLQQIADRILLLDARAAARFRGDAEPIDPVAGHVPGARNRPFSDNLAADGTFKPAAVLRREFEALLGATPAARVVHMCGSGVTACHNQLAMEHAGLPGSRVYAPSWSGWIADPSRPVATGAT